MKRAGLSIFAIAVALLAGNAYANHPVILEGNCDSPVPGTTIVTAGTCGDWDGDGRIGTAEDTDGADRIFGTLQAAIGPGTGAAAGTGANHNGTILIVTSGRFVPATSISIGDRPDGPTHLTIEAAPGVSANIDAILQGDPGGGNTTRPNFAGMHITSSNTDDRIVLRNLIFRNWAEAVRVNGAARVVIENCTFEHNLDFGVRVLGSAHVTINGSKFLDTGSRFGTGLPAAGPGIPMQFEGSTAGVVSRSVIFNSSGSVLVNNSSGGAAAVSFFQLVYAANGGGIVNATKVDF